MGKFLLTLKVILAVAYPVAVYIGLTQYSARAVGLGLLLVMGPGLIRKVVKAERAHVLAVLPLPLGVVTLLTLSAWLNDPRFVMAMPVLISLVFLATFASSLGGTPMVERFARMQEGRLSSDKIRYCRRVTVVWSLFFVFNASVSGLLAWLAPVRIWALYTGLVAYVLIGALTAAEYMVRKYNFRDYSDRLHDRWLSRLFPPQPQLTVTEPAKEVQ